MKFQIVTKPGAKRERVERMGDNVLHVFVKAPAKDGKANQAVLKALADHFNIPRARIRIVVGHSTKNKIVEIS